MPDNRSDLRATLVKAAEAGAAVLLRHFGKLESIDHKGAVDLVTIADKEAERTAIGIIRAAFPEHEILAEESGGQRESGRGVRWIIDPLDGTTNYAYNMPAFATSIGVEIDGEMVLGMVNAPVQQEIFYAGEGEGATLNGRPIRVTTRTELGSALAATGFAYDRRERADHYLRYVAAMMKRVQDIRRIGAASLDLCNVAAGRIDVYWEESLQPWDVAAGALVVREAGGRVSTYDGNENIISGQRILATNGFIHAEAMQVLSSV